MFEKVYGQYIPKRFLKRIIEEKKIPQTFLFYGKEGIGKFLCAKLFSNYLNGLMDDDISKDTFIIEKEKSIGIDEIRRLKELSYLNPEREFRVNIINDAHLLTLDASNSFLKILEEPPKRTIFILITHLPDMIQETIISRCFKIHFSPLKREEIKEFLKDKVNDVEILDLISRISDGSLKRALLYLNEKELIKRKKIIGTLISFLKRDINYIYVLKELLNCEKIEDVVILFEEIIKDMITLKRSKDESQIINIDFLKDIYETQIILDLDILLKIGELLIEFEKNLHYNINLNLILRKLLLDIIELTGGLYV
ncbi:MAG: hypothetical protein QMD25_03040 [Caldisericia bacterium]|nr:hypothetical protein [Caldisericia bacterium]